MSDSEMFRCMQLKKAMSVHMEKKITSRRELTPKRQNFDNHFPKKAILLMYKQNHRHLPNHTGQTQGEMVTGKPTLLHIIWTCTR